MKPAARRKCPHCKELFLPDRRNSHHQRFCSKAACRKASKARSQRRWLQKAGNENYFRGAVNTDRVRHWRRGHAGYWRKKRRPSKAPLQEVCMSQMPGGEGVAEQDAGEALQDLCALQPVVLVGLISTMTGSALQEDIAATARELLRRGRDILGPGSAVAPRPFTHDQASPMSSPAAARAAPV